MGALHAGRQAGGQTYRQTDRRTGGQTDRQTVRLRLIFKTDRDERLKFKYVHFFVTLLVIVTGDSANAVPLTEILRTRVTYI